MTSPSTRYKKIKSSMAKANRYMEQNLEEKTGSSGAIDFALCSIAESLQALTAMLYLTYIDEELETKEEHDHATRNT